MFNKCPVSPFLWYFIMVEVMEEALEGLPDVDLELPDEEKLCDLDYADNIKWLFESEICTTCIRQAHEDCSSVNHVIYTFIV